MGNNINDETRSFAELISNIRFNGIAWNVFPDQPQLTGEASIDVIVDNYLSGERSMVIAQYVVEFNSSKILVGVLVLVIPTNNGWFWIDPSTQNNLQSNIE
jgi:hypothetical protein